MIIIKLILTDVTWWDIDWHPRFQDSYRIGIHSLQVLISYNELEEKTRWNIFKRVHKALEGLEKGKPRKKLQNGLSCHEAPYLLAKKAEMKFLKLSPKPLSGITKRQKIEVWIFEQVTQIWLKWFNVRMLLLRKKAAENIRNSHSKIFWV